MKILIIGEVYSSNLGDGVICKNVKELLQNNYPEMDIRMIDISGRDKYDIDKIDKTLSKKEVLKSKLVSSVVFSFLLSKVSSIINKKEFDNRKEKIKSICREEKYDIAMFAGGQLLSDFFTLPILEFVNQLSDLGIPIVFNACGTGKTKSKKLKKKLTQALSNKNVVRITSRDDVDKINNIYLSKVDKHAEKTFDPALWTSKIYKIEKEESDIVGLGIMAVRDKPQKAIVAFWKNIIEELNMRHIKWKMFCNGSNIDYRLASIILSELGYSLQDKKNMLLDRPRKPEELVKGIANFNSIISFRLHSHIIAASLNIPSIAIVWDNKLKFFFSDIGLENRCMEMETDANQVVNQLINAQKEGLRYELIEKEKEIVEKYIIEYIEEVLKKNEE